MEHELSRTHVLPTMVWSAFPDGRAECLGSGWLDFTGLEHDAAIGDGWRSAVHCNDLARLLGAWEATVASGSQTEVQARLRRSDGAYCRFVFLLCPLPDANGKVPRLCVLHALVDTEDLKLTEEASLARRPSIERAQASIALTASETELRRTNQYLTLAQRLSQTGSYARVVETDEQTLSEEMYRICEFDPQKPVTHDLVLSRIHPEDLPAFEATQRAALAAGKDFAMTYRMVMPSGAVKHLRSFSQRQKDITDRLVYVGATQDVTEWKLAEAALKANEAELRRTNNELLRAYRHIAEAQRLSHTGSFTLDFSENELFWSEELYRIFELDVSTTITLDLVKSFVHPLDVPAYAAAVEGATAGLDIDFAFRIITAGGVVKHLRAVGHRIEHTGDRPVFVGAVQDVTASRVASEALRRSEAFLADGQRLSKTGSFSWRTDTNEILFSEELCRIFDIEPRATVTLELILSRVHPLDVQLVQDKTTHARCGGDDLDYEVRLRGPDGHVKHLHTFAHSLVHSDGRREVLGAMLDITQRRIAEETLDKVRSELAHAARAMSLGALAASIAHEVNQPLASLVTNASTCVRVLGADAPDLDFARTMAQRTIRDANRASEVIQRLRAMFSRKRAVAEAVDLNEAAREVLALSASALQSARIVSRAEFADALPKIRGDRVQLQQVILNLVLNATDAMREVDDRPRHLWIRTSRDGPDEVSLSVRDEGSGLDPENLERLFDAFYTTKSEGMGIGLSISRSIIQGHGGRLWAACNVNGPGATFSFSIPCDLAGSKGLVSKEA